MQEADERERGEKRGGDTGFFLSLRAALHFARASTCSRCRPGGDVDQSFICRMLYYEKQQ